MEEADGDVMCCKVIERESTGDSHNCSKREKSQKFKKEKIL